jgi:hypothetical protein
MLSTKLKSKMVFPASLLVVIQETPMLEETLGNFLQQFTVKHFIKVQMY